MSSKKQKREAGAARAAIYAEQERNLGLKAQEADRARRELAARKDAEREVARAARERKALREYKAKRPATPLDLADPSTRGAIMAFVALVEMAKEDASQS